MARYVNEETRSNLLTIVRWSRNEVDIKGHDGVIYKGRIDVERLPALDMHKKTSVVLLAPPPPPPPPPPRSRTDAHDAHVHQHNARDMLGNHHEREAASPVIPNLEPILPREESYTWKRRLSVCFAFKLRTRITHVSLLLSFILGSTFDCFIKEIDTFSFLMFISLLIYSFARIYFILFFTMLFGLPHVSMLSAWNKTSFVHWWTSRIWLQSLFRAAKRLQCRRGTPETISSICIGCESIEGEKKLSDRIGLRLEDARSERGVFRSWFTAFERCLHTMEEGPHRETNVSASAISHDSWSTTRSGRLKTNIK